MIRRCDLVGEDVFLEMDFEVSKVCDTLNLSPSFHLFLHSMDVVSKIKSLVTTQGPPLPACLLTYSLLSSFSRQ